MISDKFVILGFILQLWGCLTYTRDTLAGRTKPNRVTWFFWALAPAIAFAAEINKGVGLRSLMTFAVGFGPLVVFIASFVNKKSYWQLKRSDYLCGLAAVVGIILWFIFREANLAIIFSIIADAMAALPTIVKSFSHPETESYMAYAMAIISAGITLLSIDAWSVANYGFPIYILLINIIFVYLIKFEAGLKIKTRNAEA